MDTSTSKLKGYGQRRDYNISHSHTLMRSGHKSNAVCTVIVKHFNTQSDHSPKLRDNITYSISVMYRHSRSKTSHFVDHSPLISVHDITTCMNVHGRYIILERLKNMYKQQTSSFQSSLVKCCVSLRQDLYEARLSVMFTNVIKIAHLVLRT